jgi:hypothetical protein
LTFPEALPPLQLARQQSKQQVARKHQRDVWLVEQPRLEEDSGHGSFPPETFNGPPSLFQIQPMQFLTEMKFVSFKSPQPPSSADKSSSNDKNIYSELFGKILACSLVFNKE